MDASHRAEHQDPTEQSSTILAAVDMPGDRRPLTRPNTEGSYSSQMQSPLFSKLPAEIRLIIWAAYFELGRIHLWDESLSRAYGVPIRGVPCLVPGRDKFSTDAHFHPCLKEYRIDKARGKDRRLLALVLTCHRIYMEAIPSLYSTPFFDLSFRNGVLELLPSLLPTIGLVNITQFSYSYYRSRLHWVPWEHSIGLFHPIWDALTSMKALKYLRFKIMVLSEIDEVKNWVPVEDEVAESVSRMVGLKRCELIVPWPQKPGRSLQDDVGDVVVIYRTSFKDMAHLSL